MIAVASFITVLMLSLLVVRIATVALTLTGLSKELARFQARSAYTGAGFTTSESEDVVGHPVRRRIIMLLMLLGNAGLVTMVASLMTTVVADEQKAGGGSTLLRLAALFVGLLVFWIVARSQWVERWMNRVIRWALDKWTDIEVRDYAGLLHLSRNYEVVELLVEPDDWLADKTLVDMGLSHEGVIVLGIEREDGTYIGAPRGDTMVTAGDTMLLYGQIDRIEDLDERPAGFEGTLLSVRARVKQHALEQEEAARQAKAAARKKREAELAAEDEQEASEEPDAAKNEQTSE